MIAYASDGYTTHDRRFLESAVDGGRRVCFLRFDGGERNLEHRPLPDGVVPVDWVGAVQPLTELNRDAFAADLARVVEELGITLVHAGPVPTVGEMSVAASPAPVIVMSWASDLLVDARTDDAVAERASAALRGASHVLVDNDAIGELAVGLGADADRVSNVPWGVDLAAFPPAPTRPQDGPLRLVGLRTFEPVYDVATTIRAVALATTDVTLTLAGSGSLEPELRTLADDLGVDVDWVGRVPEPDVPALLASHDVHVSSSTSDGTSISLLQAMASARPSLVTDIASNRTWVNDAWRFPVGDAAALARLIDGIARADLPDAGAAARALAEQRADWDHNRRRILDLYDRLGAHS